MLKEARRREAESGIIIDEFLMNDVEAFRVMHDTCWKERQQQKQKQQQQQQKQQQQHYPVRPYKAL